MRGWSAKGVQPAGSPLTSHLNRVWQCGTAVVLLALALRLVHLDEPPHFDELYHLLAARGWLAEGEFRIAEGVYDRGSAFTLLVASFFAAFGETLEVARLPSVLAGTVLVGLVFVWTRSVAGGTAATIAAALIALAPGLIWMSQFARFYMLQALLFWLGAIGVYALFERRRPAWQVLALAGGLLVCFVFAGYLQLITLIGVIGVGLWAALASGLPWLATLRRQPLWFWSTLGGLAAGAILFLVFLIVSGIAAGLLARYRETALWNQATQDAFWYYHVSFVTDYPALWTLVPIAVLIALAARPRPAGFCLCVFATAFLLHSFAAPKSPRYVQYVMPFFFVLWGIAFGELLWALRRFLIKTAARAVAPLPRFLQRAAGAALLGSSVLFVLLAHGATVKTLAHLAEVTVPPNEPSPRWEAAFTALAPRLNDETVVVTTGELQTLYYLGRYDIALSRSRLAEFSRTQFDRDPRTGRPVIGSAEALAQVMDCFPRGLIVLPEHHWRDPAQVAPAVADLILRRADEADLPPSLRIRAFQWQHPPPAASDACNGLPSLRPPPDRRT